MQTSVLKRSDRVSGDTRSIPRYEGTYAVPSPALINVARRPRREFSVVNRLSFPLRRTDRGRASLYRRLMTSLAPAGTIALDLEEPPFSSSSVWKPAKFTVNSCSSGHCSFWSFASDRGFPPRAPPKRDDSRAAVRGEGQQIWPRQVRRLIAALGAFLYPPVCVCVPTPKKWASLLFWGRGGVRVR